MPFLLRLGLSAFLVPYALIALISCGGGEDSGASLSSNATTVFAHGGFVETIGNEPRSRWTSQQLKSFLPSGRGKFTFPAPYNTEAMRVTTAADCGGDDCVLNVGYSYWRNMNNHVGSNQMLIFLGLNRNRGGDGPTLFSYDKSTDEISSLGPLFDPAHRLSEANPSGWYFSARLPTKLYVNDGSRMLRYDVITKETEVVYDVLSEYGADRRVWQMSSSDDDRVHAATLRVTSTGAYLGCFVYLESSMQFLYYPKVGTLDECQVDKSGRYLLIMENMDGRNGLDNRYIDLQTGAETRLLNLPGVGTVGHHDLGYGYVVGHDGYNAMPNATLTWNFAPSLSKGPIVHRDYNWELVQANHISHTNAKPGIPKEQQYACGSNADRVSSAQNEILCFRLDGSMKQLVVAPVMTNLDASGGGDDYAKAPKGNLDVTGQYFIWTTNVGSSRLDAFIVKVPGNLLAGP